MSAEPKVAELPPRCRIVGVHDNGVEGLTPGALAHLRSAEVVIGGTRTLAVFAETLPPHAERRDFTGRMREVPEWIRAAQERGQRVVVLATGDPLCHGIARFLQARLCIEACEVVPNLSIVQIACARLGLPWEDLKIVSMHGKDAGEWFEGAGPEHGLYPVLRAIERHDRLAIYTSPANTPNRLARLLLTECLHEEFQIAVAERLLLPDERIVEDSVEQVASQHFVEPNIVLLWRVAPRRREARFGLEDASFEQRRPGKGLITKREVRAVSLARLRLATDAIVWDIGAGSGAVGLEAARLCAEGHVYAIEKNAADVVIATTNRAQLAIRNYTLVHGRAPLGLDAWPDPDAIFIGGSGGELPALIRLCLRRLRPGGVLAMNFVTFENVAEAIALLKGEGVHWDITQVQASRGEQVQTLCRLAAENPVWILTAERYAE